MLIEWVLVIAINRGAVNTDLRFPSEVACRQAADMMLKQWRGPFGGSVAVLACAPVPSHTGRNSQ